VLRISRARRKKVTVVHVEGRLDGDGVEELERECTEAGAPLELDLSALLTADEVGLALLRSLRDSGAALSGASRFLQLLIEGASGTRSGGRRAR
jgi:anti-anti-sigma regulatory factor